MGQHKNRQPTGYATTVGDIRYLLSLGVPVEEIAARMGRTVTAVEKMLEGAQGGKEG